MPSMPTSAKACEHGEEVVVTTLATVADGVGLRKIGDASEPTERSGEASPNDRQFEQPPVSTWADCLDGPQLDRGQPVDVHPSRRRHLDGRRDPEGSLSAVSNSISSKSASTIPVPRLRKSSKASCDRSRVPFAASKGSARSAAKREKVEAKC